MNEAKIDGSDRSNLIGFGIWIVLAVIILVWGSYWIWVAPLIAESKFDPLNALFSGLAFWGVIYAILLQKSELTLQRKELELTRGEVRGQREQLEAQNRTMNRQRFENTLFSLLNLFISTINSMEITINTARLTQYKGRECFTVLYHEFQHHYATTLQKTSPDPDLSALGITTYEQFASSRETILGQYFRTLYNIVKIIDTSDMNNKEMYIDILRAQLSSFESNLLFYNCISKYGNETFKPLVEKYGLLENVDFSILLSDKHRGLFDKSAFHTPSQPTERCG